MSINEAKRGCARIHEDKMRGQITRTVANQPDHFTGPASAPLGNTCGHLRRGHRGLGAAGRMGVEVGVLGRVAREQGGGDVVVVEVYTSVHKDTEIAVWFQT